MGNLGGYLLGAMFVVVIFLLVAIVLPLATFLSKRELGNKRFLWALLVVSPSTPYWLGFERNWTSFLMYIAAPCMYAIFLHQTRHLKK
jgi:predicted membrane-bound mannosyltransferase